MVTPITASGGLAASVPERLAGWTLTRAPQPAAEEHVGALFAGRYLLTRKIGGGGMSTIYEARDATLGARVVVKIMRGDLPTDHVDRFRREAHIQAGLTHEHIARIIDRQDPEDGPRFHVTDYIDGIDLSHLRRNSPVPVPVVIQIGLQVSAALAYAHAAGVIHRDIKPSNVMLVRHPGGDIFAKVIDFGIAKLIRGSDLAAPGNAPPAARRETRGDVVVGTAPYWCGHEGPRRDVYALALTLAELLTGEDPDPAADLSRPNIPPALAQVLASALRTDELTTMDVFHAALREADLQRPGDAETERRRYVAKIFTRDQPSGPGKAPRSDEAPRFAGRYIPIRELGHGGMGRVQLAFDTEHRRMVALKTIHPRCAGMQSLEHRFRRELHALAAIPYSGAPTLYESGTMPEPYFTMEIVEGLSLRAVLKSTRTIEPLRALDLAIALGKILCVAHDVGIIHRDVKPDNIMIDAGDRVRLIDFGACLLLPRFHQRHLIYPATPPEKRYTTGELESVGTPGYTAPEILDLSGGAGPRSDVYSVCVVLYEMLTGRPYLDKTTWHRAAIDAGEFPAAFRPVSDLLRRGTAEEPSDRMSSMSDLVRDLEVLRAHLLRRRDRHRLALVASLAFLSAVTLMLALRPAPAADANVFVSEIPTATPPVTPSLVTPIPAAPSASPPKFDRPTPLLTLPQEPSPAKAAKVARPALTQTAVIRILARRHQALSQCQAPFLLLNLTITQGRATLSTVNGMPEGDALHTCIRDELRAIRFPNRPESAEYSLSLDLNRLAEAPR